MSYGKTVWERLIKESISVDMYVACCQFIDMPVNRQSIPANTTINGTGKYIFLFLPAYSNW